MYNPIYVFIVISQMVHLKTVEMQAAHILLGGEFIFMVDKFNLMYD